MKNLLCSLLIPVLLAQAVGCYSLREIKLAELDKYNYDKLYLTTKDSSKYILLNGSYDPNISNWEAVNDSLILSTNKPPVYSKNKTTIEKEQAVIPFSSINNIKIYDFNLLTTSILIIGILGALVVYGLANLFK